MRATRSASSNGASDAPCVGSKYCMVRRKFARGERKVRIARAWRDSGGSRSASWAGTRAPRAKPKLAFETGRQIARSEAILVCGGGSGVMEAGLLGREDRERHHARRLCPARGRSPRLPTPHLDFVVYTGLGQGRNQIVVLSSDAVIAIGGEWGTLSEIAIAKKYGIPVVLLQSWSVEGPHGQGLDDLPRAATRQGGGGQGGEAGAGVGGCRPNPRGDHFAIDGPVGSIEAELPSPARWTRRLRGSCTSTPALRRHHGQRRGHARGPARWSRPVVKRCVSTSAAWAEATASTTRGAASGSISALPLLRSPRDSRRFRWSSPAIRSAR